jgi:hypothetical protein
MSAIDEHAATELKIFIDNDADLHRQQQVPIFKNLATKKVRSTYKHDLAVKLFGYLVESGAKKYAKEFSVGTDWHKMFSVPTRKAVAGELTRDFEGEFELGNYDDLLPKKYQKEMLGKKHLTRPPAHALKKSSSAKSSSVKWKPPESLKITWSVPNSAYVALWPGRGPAKDQQVLKIAGAEDMHEWLRSTYGSAYGLSGRTSSAQSHHSTRSRTDARAADDRRRAESEFRGFLREATDRQVEGIYEKEKRAGRDEYAELAIAEASRRGIWLDEDDDRYAHARKKSPSQLDREIAHVLSSGRGGK